METGNHEEVMANPTSVYASLVQLQGASSLQRLPSVGPSLGRQSSISYSRELSRTGTSIGGSFQSDKDSISCVGGDDANKSNHVSAKRLYSFFFGLR
ncbi:ABC transporter B family member [Trifolium repens]|nr:ABC transporter B family member [Trifolium repens]